MGYTTDFSGAFTFDKPLDVKILKYLTLFNETRRMKRKLGAEFGVEGEFFVFGDGFMGQNSDNTVIDNNNPASTQPGLWCQWRPTDDGTRLEWDGGEKFYYYTEWLVYLIEKIIKPNGYTLNGEVNYSGEDTNDFGKITVIDNEVLLNGFYYAIEGDGFSFGGDIQPDIKLILTEYFPLLGGEDKKKLEDNLITDDDKDNLHTVLESLDPDSELYKSVDKAIKNF